MIAEIRSDGAEPGRNSRRHDAAPDSRPGSFFILAVPSRRQAEPAPISRRHDAAPDSRQAEPAPISRTDLLRVETERSRAGRLPLAALVCANRSFRQSCSSGGMMPHPIRERTSCVSKLNALAQVACLWLRSFLQIEVFVSLVQACGLSPQPIRVWVKRVPCPLPRGIQFLHH